MPKNLPIYPFDAQRAVGTVIEIGPVSARVNLPMAASSQGQLQYGYRMGAGEVGEFIIIECGDAGIFGRIISIKLPEKERLAVEPDLGGFREAHPIGTVQLLTTILLKDGKVTGGISQYPRLGSKVYSAHPLLIKWIAETSQKSTVQSPKTLELAYIPNAAATTVSITPERLFGRHCAILGATGGGKSWTLARILEQSARHKSKVILFDATGEFHGFKTNVKHLHIGISPHSLAATSKEVVMPHTELTEADLFALFKPSGQSQVPKLRIAMKSLKVAKLAGSPLANSKGIIVKAGQVKKSFEDAYAKYSKAIESPRADFEIKNLTQQITEECIYPTGFGAAATTNWGQGNPQELSYCTTMITRIEDMINSADLSCVFQTQNKVGLFDEIEDFLKNDTLNILCISLKYLPFEHNAREIVTNAVGRNLLSQARMGRFKDKPLLIFLDEAHQFLDKSLGDENNKYPLDSFEFIAKEGRKFSLNICIATQRPRDIPEDVLSQMGTLIVHRLINEKDREVVEKASGDIDKSAAAFLPTLAPGQAAIIGVDFPIPLTVQMSKPSVGNEPDSKGPDYQKYW